MAIWCRFWVLGLQFKVSEPSFAAQVQTPRPAIISLHIMREALYDAQKKKGRANQDVCSSPQPLKRIRVKSPAKMLPPSGPMFHDALGCDGNTNIKKWLISYDGWCSGVACARYLQCITCSFQTSAASTSLGVIWFCEPYVCANQSRRQPAGVRMVNLFKWLPSCFVFLHRMLVVSKNHIHFQMTLIRWIGESCFLTCRDWSSQIYANMFLITQQQKTFLEP